jgi:hypothetical protein
MYLLCPSSLEHSVIKAALRLERSCNNPVYIRGTVTSVDPPNRPTATNDNCNEHASAADKHLYGYPTDTPARQVLLIASDCETRDAIAIHTERAVAIIEEMPKQDALIAGGSNLLPIDAQAVTLLANSQDTSNKQISIHPTSMCMYSLRQNN